MFEGKLPFLDLHFQRLVKGMEILKMDIPTRYSIDYFKRQIKKLTTKKANARIRLTVFRRDGGLYTPRKNSCQFLIEASPLSDAHFQLNKKGLSIDLCQSVSLTYSPLSNLKTGNSLPYILAALYKKENQLDDCILLNEKNRLVEASSSNLFLLIKNTIYTPPLSEGGIEGIMRNVVLSTATATGHRIKTIPLSIKKLHQADEVFLTNSIQGIQWVKHFSNVIYQNKIAQKLNDLINSKIK